jgi:hypothetical protein
MQSFLDEQKRRMDHFKAALKRSGPIRIRILV